MIDAYVVEGGGEGRTLGGQEISVSRSFRSENVDFDVAMESSGRRWRVLIPKKVRPIPCVSRSPPHGQTHG